MKDREIDETGTYLNIDNNIIPLTEVDSKDSLLQLPKEMCNDDQSPQPSAGLLEKYGRDLCIATAVFAVTYVYTRNGRFKIII